MLAFYREYPSPIVFSRPTVRRKLASQKVPQPAAPLETPRKVPQPAALLGDSLLWAIPWFHQVVLLEKVKDRTARLWYMEQTLTNGWSRNILLAMIQSDAHARHGQAISNFERLLPSPQSDLIQQTLKDPYIFDFLTLQEPFHERELETNLLHQFERFLLELGQGFAFVGRQYQLKVGNREYYIDLLFYHLKLRCFVVIDLKKGEFKPEYAGKMNFYFSVIDDQHRHLTDAPSIGLILCQDRNQIVAEYTLRGVDRPIGISEYELTRALPANLRSALPTVEEIEAELADSITEQQLKTSEIPVLTKRKKTTLSTTSRKKRTKKARKG